MTPPATGRGRRRAQDRVAVTGLRAARGSLAVVGRVGLVRLVGLVGLGLLAGCTGGVDLAGLPGPADPGAATGTAPSGDLLAAPELGACRRLTPREVARPDDDSPTVACTEAHTARTIAVGPLPARFTDVSRDDPGLGRFAYRRCSRAFRNHLGADESIAMRTVLSWAWFRPSQQAWDRGARWYRCDLVGGGEQSRAYVDLPTDSRGLLLGRPPDRWMVCADGPTVAGSVKVPCSRPHQWRAISTVRLGTQDEAYPGDRLVEVRTRDFCSDQVGAYLQYPADYDFGYTWFHEAEWQAGNRRSVCWGPDGSVTPRPRRAQKPRRRS